MIDLFNNFPIDAQQLAKMQALPAIKQQYVVAITPRSGSSYLCDVMTKSRCFGQPDEFINPDTIAQIMAKIPGRTPEEYLTNILKFRRARNGISGLKASWFHWQRFSQAMNDEQRHYLTQFKYIYLTRRNLIAQAISLYRATASSVFHTNIQHSPDALNKFQAQQYDYEAIKFWYEHIAQQEQGWQQYFYQQRIYPLCLTYEDVETDIVMTLKRIANYLGIDVNSVLLPKEASSIFEKVGDQRNIEWTHRFAFDYAQKNT